MADYLDLELAADASQLYQDGVDTITDLAPGDWTPSEIEQWILEAVARIAVEIALTAGVVPIAIFIYFGQTILNIPALQASPATGTVTFTAIDDAGYLIDTGTEVNIDGQPFTTDAVLSIPAGTSTGTIGISAKNTGIDGNDLAGTSITVVSPSYLFIANVELDAPTGEGSDGETGEDYADRLADELPTLSPKAILINDFETFARRNANVGRALAIDNYNPDTDDDAAEGHVTIAVHNLTGGTVLTGDKTSIKNDVEANRVLNITAHLIDGTYSTIDVAFSGVAYDEYDPASVNTDAEARVDSYLDPTAWGRPDFADADRWVNERTLYIADVVGVVRNTTGLRHLTSLTLALVRAATAVAATDVITSTAHGYSDGDTVTFSDLTGGAGITPATTYYVRDSATDTFKVAATLGGSAVNITTDMTAGKVRHFAATDIALPGIAPLPTAGTVTGTIT